MDRIAKIKEKYSVLEYARDILGLPVKRDGDRCKSLAPNSKNPTSLIIFNDWWYDFKLGCGGDVIDLCACAKFDGDKGKAIRELAGEDYEWREYTQNLNNKIAYFQSKLRDSDLSYLRGRRISDDTTKRLRLGYDEKEDRLIIPYFKNGYVAYYVGRDRSGNSEASKYKKAHLDGMNENIPWGLHSFSDENRTRVASQVNSQQLKLIENFIVIAEGAFDAMSFEQAGFRVLSPISGYFNKQQLKQVVSMLKTAPYVFVCFDSDQAGTRFTLNMCEILFKNRIKFVCGSLPEGVKDVSDFYTAGGDLFELVSNAKPGFEMLASKLTDGDEFQAFIYDAARFVEEPELAEFFDNVKNFSATFLKSVWKKAVKIPPEPILVEELLANHMLKFAEGQGFFEYNHGVWTQRSDNTIAGYFLEVLGKWANGGKLIPLERFLRAQTTTDELFNRQPVFNFRNGVLELNTGKFREHSPADMSSIQVNYNFDGKAKCEKWQKFIGEIMAEREASIKLLQEMTGYVLFNDCSMQKCFFLIGDGANGKSVFLNVISAVFDEANVSNVEMSSLIEPFQRISLMNSLVNISTETSSNVKGAESIFKQVVGGDMISGCFKSKDFVSFKPRCVMISACNEYIKSHDTTAGFLRRICFIDFPRKFEGKKADRNLESKLKTELPGIFNWAYEGYKRLKAQGGFTETNEQKEMMSEFISLMNPIASFIEDCLQDEDGILERGQLYRKYVEWTKEVGHEAQSQTRFIQNFKKTIKQVMPHVMETRSSKKRYFDFSHNLLSADELAS
ncbi:MAG: toprim domain-containing protein [Synergistaceae bacterium]|nr:toprim domain-containing protein [Synergistaceae bacterium]